MKNTWFGFIKFSKNWKHKNIFIIWLIHRTVDNKNKSRTKKSNKNVFHQSRSNFSYLSNMSNHSNISTERTSNNWQSSSRLKNNGHKKGPKKGKKGNKGKSKKTGNRTNDSQISSKISLNNSWNLEFFTWFGKLVLRLKKVSELKYK